MDKNLVNDIGRFCQTTHYYLDDLIINDKCTRAGRDGAKEEMHVSFTESRLTYCHPAPLEHNFKT